MLTIGDHNYHRFLGHDASECGGERRLCTVKPRDYNSAPYGAGITVASKFASGAVRRIPVEEWPDRIADLERTKASAFHVWEQSRIGALDQNGIGYCHAFSAVAGIMLAREMQGLPYVELSASSIGGPITGWRNEGAYIQQDLRQAVEYGACSTAFGPMLSTNRHDFKAGWENDAKNYRVVEWWEGEPNDWIGFVSCLLAGYPVCAAYNWWGHAVTPLRVIVPTAAQFAEACRFASRFAPEVAAVYLADLFDIDFLNSWSARFGTRGVGRLTGTKKRPNEWYVLRQIVNHSAAT